MPFDAAIAWIEQDCLKKRGDALKAGQRIPFVADKFASFAEMVALFDSQQENEAWLKEWNSERPDTNLMIGQRDKVAWMCGNRRDIRMQFCAGADDRHRTALDHQRFEVLRLWWAQKGLQRLREIVTKERTALS